MPQPRRRIERTCEICHTMYDVKPSLATSRFCSWACTMQARADTRLPGFCLECGQPFLSYKKTPRKYCSISCGITARNKTDQNPAFHRDITGAKNPMYKKGQAGEKNGMFGKRREQSMQWKGGRKIRKDGYVLILAPPDHPYAISNRRRSSATKYLLEHRYVMEQVLGRYLLREEVVHHKDGNPSNNALDNLELCDNQSTHISTQHTHKRQKQR